MKCDELKRKYSDITGPYYGYNEVNEAIDELKTEHHKERHEYIEMVAQLRRENAELKKKLDEKESWVKMLGEGEAALSLELEKAKQKLESVQASMYADVVDANMENRRLKRALYNLRACYADMMQKRYIECKTDGWVHRVNKWIDVERRCRNKAEEYK